MPVHISHFGQKVNLSLCRFLDEFALKPANDQKTPISFLSGDPTAYGQQRFRMPQRGYQLLKQSIIDENHHGYGPSVGIPSFRKAILNLYNSKIPVDISDVFINHGVNVGLLQVLMAVSNEGEEILVPEFGYPIFNDLCPAMKRKVVPYRLLKHKNFQIDLQNLGSLVSDKTAFIFIINPANPTGSVFSREHMQQILNFSDQYQVPLVCDQVYFRQTFPGVQRLSFGQVTTDTPVIVLCGVEKMLSVPGWVQSWIILFDKHDVLKHIKRNLEITATLFLHTNMFTQHALVKILEQIGIFTIEKMPILQENAQKLIHRLKQIKGFKPIQPQGTIYLSIEIQFPKFLDIQNDVQFVQKLKLQQNVRILPLSSMGAGVQGLRLLTCAGPDYYQEFFERIIEFVELHSLKE